jgi:hypothetical protein
LYNVGRISEAAALIQEVIPLAEGIGADDVLGNAHNVLGNALAWLGRPGADDEFRDALSIYERRGFLPGQAMVYLNLGASAYWEGRWTEAAELYQRALDLHTRTANPIEAAFAAMNIAEVYLEQGKLSEAEACWDASRARSSGIPGARRSLNYLGRWARAGRLAEAEEPCGRPRLAYENAGMKGGALEVDAREAERLVMAGRTRRSPSSRRRWPTRARSGVEVLARCWNGPAATPWRSSGRSRRVRPAGTLTSRERCSTRCRCPYKDRPTGTAGLERADGVAIRQMRDIFERLGVIVTPAYLTRTARGGVS